jgi:type I restriction enzyme S subunit
MTPQELKNSILQLAIQGKLVEQIKGEYTSNTLGFDIANPPFDIPETWKWQTLGSCCEMYTGNSIAESEKSANYAGLAEGYDYIATKDVSFEQKIEYDNGLRIPFDNTFKRAYKDSVLMCIEGGSAGRKIGILDRDVCFGNKLCMFRADKVLNTFMFYYLQSAEFKRLFSENMTGIIGGVSIKKLKEILMPIPPLAEQKRIVAKIEELLPYIDRYEQAWRKQEDFNKRFPTDMQKSILQTAIQGKLVEQRPEEGTGEELYQQIQAEKQKLIKAGKIKKEKPLPEITEDEVPFEIPESWRWVHLLDIVEKRPANGYSPKGVDHVTPVRNLTLTATTSGYFKADAFKYVDISLEAATKFWLNKNDLLIQRSNSRELVGTSCIYTGEDKAYIYPDLMMRMRTMVVAKYVDFVMKSPTVRTYFMKSASGTSKSMPKINQDIVAYTLIPLPPLAEQKRIVAKLEEVLLLCEKLKGEKTK